MMTLLISKTCMHCEKVEEAACKFPQIQKFYVTNGNIALDAETFAKLDNKIPALPALITEKVVYIGEKYILDFLETLSQENK